YARRVETTAVGGHREHHAAPELALEAEILVLGALAADSRDAVGVALLELQLVGPLALIEPPPRRAQHALAGHFPYRRQPWAHMGLVREREGVVPRTELERQPSRGMDLRR